MYPLYLYNSSTCSIYPSYLSVHAVHNMYRLYLLLQVSQSLQDYLDKLAYKLRRRRPIKKRRQVGAGSAGDKGWVGKGSARGGDR